MAIFGEYPGELDSPQPTATQRAAYLAWQEGERERQHEVYMADKRRRELREAWGSWQFPRWLKAEADIAYKTRDCGYR